MCLYSYLLVFGSFEGVKGGRSLRQSSGWGVLVVVGEERGRERSHFYFRHKKYLYFNSND